MDDPIPGHDRYRGMLAIPYLRRSHDGVWSVASIRFRRLGEGDGSKYLTQPGDRPRMYNTLVLQSPVDTVAITEGEFDAITSTISGIPAVGIPGSTSWQPWFRIPFEGYRRVYVLADGDEAGNRFAEQIASELSNAMIISMPDREDVSSVVAAHGKGRLIDMISGG